MYYFNFKSGESIWEHPCDVKYRKMFEDEKAKKLAAKKSGTPYTGGNTAATGKSTATSVPTAASTQAASSLASSKPSGASSMNSTKELPKSTLPTGCVLFGNERERERESKRERVRERERERERERD
jgi:hypothetical protein